MRTSFLALVAAIASPGFAQNKPQLQSLPAGRLVQPSRAASYTVIDGRIVLTSDWIPLSNAAPRELYFEAAFDAAEHDNTGGVLGFPTDNIDGCTGKGAPGSRWFFGNEFNNPFVSADLRTEPEDAGVLCEAISLEWYINVGDAETDINGDGFPDADLYIATATFENMDVVGCSDDGSGPLGGLIFDFSGTVWDPGFFQFANITLNSVAFVYAMPADSVGGYQTIFATRFDPESGQLTVPTGIDPLTQRGVAVQPMLWGTGDNERTFDGRRGHDVDGQFDDGVYSPADGRHDLESECVSHRYGVCPDPLCAATTFWKKDQPDPCPSDLNGDGYVDLADLPLLLGSFGRFTSEAPTSRADIDRDGIISISDLAIFLASFGSIC